MPSDSHNLQRFLDAQESMYDKALVELKEGKKKSHWMWFVFPQTPKPGMSTMSRHYAMKSKEEAREYLEHDTLGSRLITCTEAVFSHKDKTLIQIFGTELDAMKFLSCMRLFRHVGGKGSVFERGLEVYERGEG